MKENSNGTDTNVGRMENSIEEDIKNAEHFIKSIKTDKEYKEENGWHGYYNKEIVELARILQHILSDYKRVLKENEELKLYNNSITSQLEQMTTEKFKNGWFHQSEFKDSIPAEKIKDKIEKYKKLSDKFYVKFLESDRYNTDIREKGIKCDAIILALEELIEEREEK